MGKELDCCAGPLEQGIEEEWEKLQEHPDILATAPDDEVLAEMLAMQVSLHCCSYLDRFVRSCTARSLFHHV